MGGGRRVKVYIVEEGGREAWGEREVKEGEREWVSLCKCVCRRGE